MPNPERPTADMTPSEVKALIPYCGPVYPDTPESVRAVLEDEDVEEQTAMFEDWLDAAIWLFKMLALSLGIAVVLVFIGISIYTRFHG